MRFQSYFNSAVRLIQLYDGKIPLHHYLKKYFAGQKKYGSKDRKIISHLCYNFYRLGKSYEGISIEERLKIAIFLCNDSIEEWRFLYNEDWMMHHSNLLPQRLEFLKNADNLFSLKDVFPFQQYLSEGIDVFAFEISFFIQPGVFIRIRPGNNKAVENKLKLQNISFYPVADDCIAIPASTKIDLILEIDKEAVIQDYSSGRLEEFLNIIKVDLSKREYPLKTWDCCAGSGGKSILAHDILNNLQLTVTDIRPTIIHNLKKRFIKAGIKNYKSSVLDLSNANFEFRNPGFDFIICDAPCTGSGTWGRSPEQLYFFDSKKIIEFASLQQKIPGNAIPQLNKNGYFLYITCSVFKHENEQIVEFIKKQYHLDLIKMELLKGYEKKADTMFAALFKKTI